MIKYLFFHFNSVRKLNVFPLFTEAAFSGAPRFQSGHLAGQVELGEVIFDTQIYIFLLGSQPHYLFPKLLEASLALSTHLSASIGS